jgi:hypothetical protein
MECAIPDFNRARDNIRKARYGDVPLAVNTVGSRGNVIVQWHFARLSAGATKFASNVISDPLTRVLPILSAFRYVKRGRD